MKCTFTITITITITFLLQESLVKTKRIFKKSQQDDCVDLSMKYFEYDHSFSLPDYNLDKHVSAFNKEIGFHNFLDPTHTKLIHLSSNDTRSNCACISFAITEGCFAQSKGLSFKFNSISMDNFFYKPTEIKIIPKAKINHCVMDVPSDIELMIILHNAITQDTIRLSLFFKVNNFTTQTLKLKMIDDLLDLENGILDNADISEINTFLNENANLMIYEMIPPLPYCRYKPVKWIISYDVLPLTMAQNERIRNVIALKLASGQYISRDIITLKLSDYLQFANENKIRYWKTAEKYSPIFNILYEKKLGLFYSFEELSTIQSTYIFHGDAKYEQIAFISQDQKINPVVCPNANITEIPTNMTSVNDTLVLNNLTNITSVVEPKGINNISIAINSTNANTTIEPQKENVTNANTTIEPQKENVTNANTTIEPQKENVTNANTTIEPQKENSTNATTIIEPQNEENCTDATTIIEPQKENVTNVTTTIESQKENATNVTTIIEPQKENATNVTTIIEPVKKNETEMDKNTTFENQSFNGELSSDTNKLTNITNNITEQIYQQLTTTAASSGNFTKKDISEKIHNLHNYQIINLLKYLNETKLLQDLIHDTNSDQEAESDLKSNLTSHDIETNKSETIFETKTNYTNTENNTHFKTVNIYDLENLSKIQKQVLQEIVHIREQLEERNKLSCEKNQSNVINSEEKNIIKFSNKGVDNDSLNSTIPSKVKFNLVKPNVSGNLNPRIFKKQKVTYTPEGFEIDEIMIIGQE